MSISRPLLSLVFTTLAFVSPVAAQVHRRSPLTGVQVMQSLREKGSVGHAQRTLMQIDGPVPRGVQDELADSMVAYVSAVARRGSTDDANAVLSIVHALSLSGMRGMSGTPYAGAGERLLQLAHSVDLTTGARIVYALSELVDQTEARARLRTFATSAHPAAYIAIEHLARMEPEGVVVLRELWEKQAVTEPKARGRLQSIAGHLGWSDRPSSPPTRRPPRGV